MRFRRFFGLAGLRVFGGCPVAAEASDSSGASDPLIRVYFTSTDTSAEDARLLSFAVRSAVIQK